jgi:hypothetical protein
MNISGLCSREVAGVAAEAGVRHAGALLRALCDGIEREKSERKVMGRPAGRRPRHPASGIGMQ